MLKNICAVRRDEAGKNTIAKLAVRAKDPVRRMG